MFTTIRKYLLPLPTALILCMLIIKTLPLTATAVDSPQAIPINTPTYKIIDGRKYILVRRELQSPLIVEDDVPGPVSLPYNYPYNFVICHHFPCLIVSRNGHYYYAWGGRYNPVYYDRNTDKYLLEDDPDPQDTVKPVCVINGMPGPITLPIDYAKNYIMCRSFKCPIELINDQPCYQWGRHYYPIYFR